MQSIRPRLNDAGVFAYFRAFVLLECMLRPDFSEFDTTTSDAWQQRIVSELKGRDYATLWQQTFEGLSWQPFYTAEDVAHLQYLRALHQHMPPAGWQYREVVSVTHADAANQQAHQALARGADTLLFDFGQSDAVPDLSRLLARLNPNQQAIHYRTAHAGPLLEQLRQLNPSLTALKGSLQADPYDHLLRTGQWMGTDDLVAASRAFADSPGFWPLALRADAYHTAGGHAVHEVAFLLAAAVHLTDALTEAGLSPATVLNQFEFSLPIDTDFFVQIAKLRALRWLWLKIGATYGVSAHRLHLHAHTSAWSHTDTDPDSNLLRHTTEAIAAVVGGCQSLTVLSHRPHDAHGQRLARNLSALLREEAYFDKATDPAAGAYFFDHLTDALAQAAWQLFLEVEQQGGWQVACERGFIAEQIATVRQRKADAIATGKRVLVGANKFRPANAITPPVADSAPSAAVLPRTRAEQWVKS